LITLPILLMSDFIAAANFSGELPTASVPWVNSRSFASAFPRPQHHSSLAAL
jgi:hypothetical protein